MIYDKLANASLYSLGARFDKAFDYLRSDRARTDAPGKYELDGDNVFALVQEYDSKPISEGFWEAHYVYADVQYIVTGLESMGVAARHTMAVREDRAPAQDVVILDGDGAFLALEAGMFTVFFPQDAHMPGIVAGSPQRVRKIVIKVKVKG